jgi:hypothetical protein
MTEQPSDTDATAESEELPEPIIERSEQLTRRARAAVDPNERAAYIDERDELLAEHGFTARVRNDQRAVLVLYPDEWVEDGTVYPERIEDIDRGIERPLEGVAESNEWAEIDAHNRDIVAAVEDDHGPVHGANAEALADFMSNHYKKPIERATGDELRLFVEEYFPRNAWPTDDQRAVVEESIRLVFASADEPVPRDAPLDG